MIPAQDILLFALAALVMVLTPGPNMIYLVSRSVCQGKAAARLSLVGVGVGFLLHMSVAALGLTAFFLAVPYAYDALKFAGAAYLLWLAWQAVRPGARNPLTPRDLPPDSPARLFWMGFLTNALNPKIAVFYVSIFTQFLHPERGSVFGQSIVLGCIHILVSMTVNALIIESAAQISTWFTRRPFWSRIQRWLMGTVLAGLAVKLALSDRR